MSIKRLSLVLLLGTAACASAPERPQTASADASPAERRSIPADPFPSTYRAYPGQPTRVTNVTIYDGEGGRIERGEALFADGKVVAVGQSVDGK